MPSPFLCSPVIREWSWKKTPIENDFLQFFSSTVTICLLSDWLGTRLQFQAFLVFLEISEFPKIFTSLDNFCATHLFTRNNDLIPFHMSREIALKHEKVYKYFVQDRRMNMEECMESKLKHFRLKLIAQNILLGPNGSLGTCFMYMQVLLKL